MASSAGVPEPRRLEAAFKNPATRTKSSLDMTEFDGQTVVVILDEFIVDTTENGDSKNVGVKVRVYDGTGEVGKGSYRSVRLASQFAGPGDSVVALVKKFGRGAILDPNVDESAASNAIAGMTAALS